MPALVLALFFCILAAVQAHAAPPTVLDIRVEGNSRTRTQVILNEVLTRPGEPYSPERWAADVQRVEDLGIFWRVRSQAVMRDHGVSLVLRVEEKWTLIGIFDFTADEDVLLGSVGAYDTNFFGRNLELGGQLSRRRGGDGYSVWFVNPRIGASPYSVRFDASLSHTPHAVYPQDEKGDEPLGFVQANRQRFRAEVGRRLDLGDRRAVALSYQPVRTNYALLSVRDGAQLAAPPDRLLHWVSLRKRWGRLHRDEDLFHGRRFTLGVGRAFSATASVPSFHHAGADLAWFGRPLPRHNLGLSVGLGAMDRRAFEDAFTIGGLTEVRGFPHERFWGQFLWRANGEYRYPVLDNRHVLGQAAVFVDMGRAWNAPFVSRDMMAGTAVSAGGGVRVVFRRFYHSMLRIDYARTFNPYVTHGVSFGASQFF